MTNPFERGSDGVGDTPSLEQIEEYRELMETIVHGAGKGVRRARVDERARTRIGTAYFLPGAHIELRIQGKGDESYPRTERERRYSASYRQALGDNAGRLLVLESDTVYLPDVDSYSTKRRMYRFSWNEAPVGLYEAEMLPIDVVSDARTDGEVMLDNRHSDEGKLILALDHERTVEGLDGDHTTGYHRTINPWRTQQSPWERVGEADFDGLLGRTDEFKRDLLA